MYQNMDCLVIGFNIFRYTVSYTIYNSANEVIQNPVFVTINTNKTGVCVPYGGYIEVQMDDTHTMSFRVIGEVGSFLTIGANEKVKLKVVRDYETTIFLISDTNNVETYTELHP